MTADILVPFSTRRVVSRIRVRRGALEDLGVLARRVTGASRAMIVSDARVTSLYGDRALRSLRRAGIAADLVMVPRGERAKSPPVLERLWERLAGHGLGRRDLLVALGGGVVGDLTGFAAATWLRGIAWAAVPTTVLAQVDSSVGGKTGVNLASGKNLVGAFHQPVLVVTDPDTLETLSPRQRRAGLAEVAKLGMAVDGSLFRWTERHAPELRAGEPAVLAAAVRAAVAVKARVVRRDEREREGGLRTALNFGHTLGHAIEAAHAYRGVLHGEAVAVGMRAAGRLSVELAGLREREWERLATLLDRLGLPQRMPPTPALSLHRAMRLDKKRARTVRWVLTPRIGHASLPRPVGHRFAQAAMLEFGARP